MYLSQAFHTFSSASRTTHFVHSPSELFSCCCLAVVGFNMKFNLTLISEKWSKGHHFLLFALFVFKHDSVSVDKTESLLGLDHSRRRERWAGTAPPAERSRLRNVAAFVIRHFVPISDQNRRVDPSRRICWDAACSNFVQTSATHATDYAMNFELMWRRLPHHT